MKTNVQYGGGATLTNKKAFTLIELLAVIVILAIIALIAVPIIINIVNESKEASNKRSVELYGKAISNAIARSQLNGTEVAAGDLSSAFLETVQYTGSRVVCTTNKLYSDGSVYLAGCKVGSDTKEYTYGTSQESNDEEDPSQQASIPHYYYWGSGSISGGLPTTNIDTDLSNITMPNNYPFYLAFDSADGETIDAAYVCFIVTKNDVSKPYCIKGGDSGATFESNQDILDEAFPGACSLDDDYYSCYVSGVGGFGANAISDGGVNAYDGNAHCYVNAGGSFECDGR